MQIPLLSGELFTRGQTGTNVPCDHQQEIAASFPSESPLGKHVQISFGNNTEVLRNYWSGWRYSSRYRPADQGHHLSSYLERRSSMDSMATIVIRAPLSPSLWPCRSRNKCLRWTRRFRFMTVDNATDIGKATASQSFSASLVLAFAIFTYSGGGWSLRRTFLPCHTARFGDRHSHGSGCAAR